MSIQNKTAYITGAASGIGREIANLFAAKGANIVIADMNAAAAEKAAAEISATGVKALGLSVDVTNEEQVDASMDKTFATFGSVDILIANAGIQIVAPVVDFKFSDWKKLLAVHLDGSFLTTRAAMRYMIKGGKGGAIVYMGSVHSKVASKLKAPYVTAKHGLLGLARVVAKEGAEHGIRANVVCPGFVRTPLVDKQIPEQAKTLGISEEEVIKKVMLGETVDGEFTTVQDVAQACLFFAGFDNNALTGQSLIVSHGWTME